MYRKEELGENKWDMHMYKYVRKGCCEDVCNVVLWTVGRVAYMTVKGVVY